MTTVLADALIVSAIVAVLTTTAGLLFSRSNRLTGHVRHQVMVHSLLVPVIVLIVLAVATPGPIGCLSESCETDRALGARAAQAQMVSTGSAAGKFGDLTGGSVGIAEAARPTTEAAGATDGAAAVEAGGPARWGQALVVLWVVGVLVGLLRVLRRRWLAWSFVRSSRAVSDPGLRRMLADARARTDHRGLVSLREHNGLAAPVVAGLFRPVIVLPASARVDRDTEITLIHELNHLKRRDPAISLVVELAAAVFWINPLVHASVRRIADLQELAADSRVLTDGVTPSSYARLLLDTFRKMADGVNGVPSHSHSIAGRCLTETRVRAILDAGGRHGVPSRIQTSAILVGALSLALALSAAPSLLQARGVLPPQTRPDGQIEQALLNASAIDSIVRPVFINHMTDRYIAGAAIAVVHDGRTIYEGSFGRREVFRELPVDMERTIWRIGSITKVLTGVAVMQLVDRGLLDLDADVNDYLVDFKVEDTYDEPVRVRDLLTHTSGFDQIGRGRHERRLEDVRPLGEFLAENLIRIRPPREVSTYDTYGITLAGYLVEVISGLSYEEYLRTHVFRPLGMHRSGITVPPALQQDVAVGYGFAGRWEAERWEFMNTDPASTANASVPDMTNFMKMLLNDGEFMERRLLSSESLEAMLTPQWTNHPDQPGYGLTFWEDRSFGVPAMSHGGSMRGFGSLLYVVPEHDFGVYIAYNQESSSLPFAVMSELMGALFPGEAEPVIRARIEPPADMTRFAGSYANSLHHHTDPTTGWRRRPFDVTVEDGALMYQGEPAFPVGPLAFQRDDGLLITFREDADGRIQFMFVNQTVYERLD